MGSNQVDRILTHACIALDTNIFIYALENNTAFPQAAELFGRMTKSSAKIFTSVLSVLETTVPLFNLGEQQRIPGYLEFISGQGRITVVDIDQSVALKAAELRARYRFPTPDSIQLATALMQHATLFVTADRGFNVRSIDGMKLEVLLPTHS